MFNLFKEKEAKLILEEVRGVRFAFNLYPSKSNLKKFNYLKGLIDEMPTIVKEKVVERGLMIRFVSEDEMVEVVNNKNVLGFYCDANLEVIYIKNNQSYENLKNTFFHEIGHFVDKYIGRATGCDFISLVEKDLHEIACNESKVYDFFYYRENIKEYFAQSFSEFIMNSETAKKMPKTSMLMGAYVEALNVI